jgi:hypothetical protein
MIRRSTIHVLLSLLLLLSQQMAIAHAVSHWSGRAAPAAPAAAQQKSGDRSLSEAFALDQSCSQCLAFAQIGGVVGSAPFRFIPVDPGSSQVCVDPGHGAGARTVCVYHSRAPPVAI